MKVLQQQKKNNTEYKYMYMQIILFYLFIDMYIRAGIQYYKYNSLIDRKQNIAARVRMSVTSGVLCFWIKALYITAQPFGKVGLFTDAFIEASKTTHLSAPRHFHRPLMSLAPQAVHILYGYDGYTTLYIYTSYIICI